MITKFSIVEFLKEYPNDDICLDVLFKSKHGDLSECPGCGKEHPKFYRIKTRTCYSCGDCGHQIHPMVGTIMEGSTTPLQKWFVAIFLFAVSRNGVSAKELERALGVTYKCAWRIGHKIRSLMEDDDKLSGLVEVDESMFGGKKKGKRGWGAAGKELLFGMVERGKSGKIKAVVVKSRKRNVLIPIIRQTVEEGSIVHTDAFRVYRMLNYCGYDHKVKNGEGIHQNSIEGYWGNFKNSIRGTHSFVSAKHLQAYLNEFGFRYNRRKSEIPMFDSILRRI